MVCCPFHIGQALHHVADITTVVLRLHCIEPAPKNNWHGKHWQVPMAHAYLYSHCNENWSKMPLINKNMALGQESFSVVHWRSLHYPAQLIDKKRLIIIWPQKNLHDVFIPEIAQVMDPATSWAHRNAWLWERSFQRVQGTQHALLGGCTKHWAALKVHCDKVNLHLLREQHMSKTDVEQCTISHAFSARRGFWVMLTAWLTDVIRCW